VHSCITFASSLSGLGRGRGLGIGHKHGYELNHPTWRLTDALSRRHLFLADTTGHLQLNATIHPLIQSFIVCNPLQFDSSVAEKSGISRHDTRKMCTGPASGAGVWMNTDR
jgi:hypothetical protein